MRHLLCTMAGSIAIAIAFAGCDTKPAIATPPCIWSATLSGSGGVTGGGGSATINSDGVLTGESWDAAGDQPVATETKEVPEQDLADLHEAISDPGLQSAPAGQPQNMTTEFSVEIDGDKKKWIDNGQSDSVSRAIAAFRSAVAAAVSIADAP